MNSILNLHATRITVLHFEEQTELRFYVVIKLRLLSGSMFANIEAYDLHIHVQGIRFWP